MNKIQFEELAIRYFTGDLDSEGILLLEDEIRQSEEAKKTFDELKEITKIRIKLSDNAPVSLAIS